MAKERDIKKG